MLFERNVQEVADGGNPCIVDEQTNFKVADGVNQVREEVGSLEVQSERTDIHIELLLQRPCRLRQRLCLDVNKD